MLTSTNISVTCLNLKKVNKLIIYSNISISIIGKEEWCAKPLTMDHKPESAAEMQRIQSSGGKVFIFHNLLSFKVTDDTEKI